MQNNLHTVLKFWVSAKTKSGQDLAIEAIRQYMRNGQADGAVALQSHTINNDLSESVVLSIGGKNRLKLALSADGQLQVFVLPIDDSTSINITGILIETCATTGDENIDHVKSLHTSLKQVLSGEYSLARIALDQIDAENQSAFNECILHLLLMTSGV